MFHNDVQTESQSDLKSSQLWEKWKATVPRAKGYGGTGQATFLHPTNIQISFLNLICSQFLSITVQNLFPTTTLMLRTVLSSCSWHLYRKTGLFKKVYFKDFHHISRNKIKNKKLTPPLNVFTFITFYNFESQQINQSYCVECEDFQVR